MTKITFLMAILIVSFAFTANADETGLASIHDTRHESGRRICMSDHFHDGNGSGKTRTHAEQAAEKSWAEFTAFEYGAAWGSYQLAESKSTNCAEMANQWTCVVAARPCKRYVKPAKGVSEAASR